MPYTHFTDEQKLQANNVDLELLLRSRGEGLIPSGREKRLEADHSITVQGSRWYDHATGEGGGAVSFVQKFYKMSYADATLLLLGGDAGQRWPSARERPERQAKPFQPPPAAPNMRRAFAYLVKTRKISREVLVEFVRAGLVYEDAKFHNAVFLGLDENDTPRHAHRRSTNSEGKSFRANVEGSDTYYAFHWLGGDDQLYVFEAPIDMLSYITLHPEGWQDHNYVACCGVSAIPVLKMLEMSPQILGAALCYDNDTAGNAAAERVSVLLEERGIASGRMCSIGKDWNEDLTQGLYQQSASAPVMQMC